MTAPRGPRGRRKPVTELCGIPMEPIGKDGDGWAHGRHAYGSAHIGITHVPNPKPPDHQHMYLVERWEAVIELGSGKERYKRAVFRYIGRTPQQAKRGLEATMRWVVGEPWTKRP